MPVDFSVSPVEKMQLERIAKLATDNLEGCILLNVLMDLTACHANGCQLNLHAMLEAPESILFHDLQGITQNINRETGELDNGFVSRFAT